MSWSLTGVKGLMWQPVSACGPGSFASNQLQHGAVEVFVPERVNYRIDNAITTSKPHTNNPKLSYNTGLTTDSIKNFQN